MMLDWLGEEEAADLVKRAVDATLAEGTVLTGDLGGHSSTSAMGDAICEHIRECGQPVEEGMGDGGEGQVIKRIGFVGLGQMGKWMATNLLKAGHDLTVLARHAALVDQGVSIASSAAEMAAATDIVFLSLPDTAVVESVLFGPGGIAEGARPGLVVVDLSTIAYRETLEIARRLDGMGVRFADAPVSGMEARAREATLTIMFGGDKGLFSEMQPYLGAIGNTVIYMGKVGSGQLTKLINQLLFNTVMASMAELLPMAMKLGLDPEKLTEVVTTGTGRSFGVEFFAPRILENRFDEGYPLAKAYKDMISAAEISAHQQNSATDGSDGGHHLPVGAGRGAGRRGQGSIDQSVRAAAGGPVPQAKQGIAVSLQLSAFSTRLSAEGLSQEAKLRADS